MKIIILSFLIFKYSHGQSNGLFGCVQTEPECPNENVTFHFYTRETANNPKLLNVNEPESFTSANFVNDRPLIILLHGFTGHKDYSPNSHLRPAFFKRDEFNIVSIDYEPLAKYPCYLSGVRNIQTVSNCTAQFIDYIIDNDIFSIEAIHLIGFSLGAQAAGLTANYLKDERKLKRITGLDPAKPLFVRVGDEGRLDESDADFVDIIHTDVFDRGLLVPTGHVDFYVNGGHSQPGCYSQTEMSPGSCNHDRAPQYYAESINSDFGFWGYRCPHWYLYVLGMCKMRDDDELLEMGFYANNSSRGLYFLNTNAKSPFARGKNNSNNFSLQDEESLDISNNLD